MALMHSNPADALIESAMALFADDSPRVQTVARQVVTELAFAGRRGAPMSRKVTVTWGRVGVRGAQRQIWDVVRDRLLGAKRLVVASQYKVGAAVRRWRLI